VITAPLGPVAGAYYLDNSRVAIIEGPVGSGKSVASCLKIQRIAYAQAPSPDGIAYTRHIVVRNTKPQLKDTTIKTWLEVFPESMYGHFLRGDNLSHIWRFKPKGYDYAIDAEILFRALDDAADVANLLSLEATTFWFNEVREIDEEIIAHAGRRLRYRNGERPSTFTGLFGDTNPWDTAHYLQERLVTKPREGWKHFRQPGGMDEDAENLCNLEQTAETMQLPHDHPKRRNQGRQYYRNALIDYSAEDARVYVHAKRGITRSGKPIYTDFNDRVHCKPFELDPTVPLRIGMDFGRTPAAVIAQRSVFGQWRVRWELCSSDMGVKAFGFELKRFLAEKMGGTTWEIDHFTGDPAGDQRDGDDHTAFMLLSASGWAMARPASTNEPTIRVGTVNEMFRTMAGGEPALLIHPECTVLHRACIDGYHFRKLQVAGNRFDDKPNKNEFSHVAEALQYLLLGGGEGKAHVKRTPSSVPRPARPPDAENWDT
jgi:hypothetical protein